MTPPTARPSSSAVLDVDARYLWHPWSPTRVTPETILIERAAGCEVVDADGITYLDAKSSGLNATLGYGCEPVLEAADEQLRRLMTYDLGEGASIPPALLARDIAQLTGPGLNRTFFCGSGSEAVEAAIRIARFHHEAAGAPDRVVIVALDRSYHGATMGAAAATGHGTERLAGPATAPGFVHLPTPRRGLDVDDRPLAALRELFAARAQEIAAIMLEPVSARTGLPLPTEYVHVARDLCTRHGVLLILDEVTTGFGRTGTMFAHQVDNVLPDILCTSKGLGAGYTSIGAVTTTDVIFTRFEAAKGRAMFVHGHTHSGHATSCATARAVLRYLREEDVLRNVLDRSAQIFGGLADVAELSAAVTSIQGRGLLIGMEFVDPASAARVREAMLQDRILVRRTGRTIIIAPPLIIDEAQTARLVASGRAAIETIAEQAA